MTYGTQGYGIENSYDPTVMRDAYRRVQEAGNDVPFFGESDLEIIAQKEPATGDRETREAAVICAFFICNLPFDC